MGWAPTPKPGCFVQKRNPAVEHTLPNSPASFPQQDFPQGLAPQQRSSHCAGLAGTSAASNTGICNAVSYAEAGCRDKKRTNPPSRTKIQLQPSLPIKTDRNMQNISPSQKYTGCRTLWCRLYRINWLERGRTEAERLSDLWWRKLDVPRLTKGSFGIITQLRFIFMICYNSF